MAVSPPHALAGIAEARGDLEGAAAAYEDLLKRCRATRQRQAQRAAGSGPATTALRLAVSADPAFGLAIADLGAITGTASQVSSHRQMNWEPHHIEVVRAAATGNAGRAADLLRNTSPASAAAPRRPHRRHAPPARSLGPER